MKRIIGGLSTIVLAAGLSLVGSAPAEAAEMITVQVQGNNVIVTGTSGPDSPTITDDCSLGAYCTEFIDSVDFLYAAPCEPSSSLSVQCPTPGPPVVMVNLGAGNDEFVSGGAYQSIGPGHTVVVDAGPGNDVLEGAGAVEIWKLGEGDDQLQPDQIGGPDEVGPDDISGGPGSDFVDYLFSAADDYSGLTISFDDLPNDVSAIANDIDNVRSDVERLKTTNNNDTITGNDLPQNIDGSSGNDTISGGGGDDVINGWYGVDPIEGGAGADTIYGGRDNDSITGGPGYDTINGDTTNLLDTGNDTINAVDGEADYVACGPGSDSVSADYLDQIAAQAQDNCEQVTLTQPPVVSPPPPGVPGAGSVKVAGKKLDANKVRTKAVIAIRCTATTACSGKAVVKAGKKVVAKGKYAAAAGTTAKVSLKLTQKARALLRKRAAVKVVLTLTPGSTAKVKLTR